MAVRGSKRALAEVAAMLGTDAVSARAYLRQIQRLAGPAPYEAIVDAMRRAGSCAVEDVAAAIGTGPPPAPGE